MFAETIKNMRKQRGMTQTALAEQLDITRSSVNAWEMGLSLPSTQYIVELAEIFGVSSDYLLGVNHVSTVSVDGLTEEDVLVVHELIRHFREKNRSC